MTLPLADTARFELIRSRLCDTVVGDVTDTHGLYYHRFFKPQIRPLVPGMVIVGRAMTVLVADAFGSQRSPSGELAQAVDQLEAGEVHSCGLGDSSAAEWVELLTVTVRTRGSADVVIDGYHRGTTHILEQSWPVFSRCAHAQEAVARAIVVDDRVTVEDDGVCMLPGDRIFGDCDGVLVIPESRRMRCSSVPYRRLRRRTLRRAIEGCISPNDALRTSDVS